MPHPLTCGRRRLQTRAADLQTGAKMSRHGMERHCTSRVLGVPIFTSHHFPHHQTRTRSVNVAWPNAVTIVVAHSGCAAIRRSGLALTPGSSAAGVARPNTASISFFAPTGDASARRHDARSASTNKEPKNANGRMRRGGRGARTFLPNERSVISAPWRSR